MKVFSRTNISKTSLKYIFDPPGKWKCQRIRLKKIYWWHSCDECLWYATYATSGSSLCSLECTNTLHKGWDYWVVCWTTLLSPKEFDCTSPCYFVLRLQAPAVASGGMSDKDEFNGRKYAVLIRYIFFVSLLSNRSTTDPSQILNVQLKRLMLNAKFDHRSTCLIIHLRQNTIVRLCVQSFST